MKRVPLIATILATASMGLATGAHAVQPSQEPFLYIFPSTHSVDLGTAVSPGFFEVPKALTLRIESNCLHGPVKVSVTDLKRGFGGSIPPARFYVRSSATWGFVPMDRPVAVSKTQTGSHDIVLDLQVETAPTDLAGQYRGALMITVMPPV